MNEITFPIIFLTGSGAVLGLILGIVAKVMHVPVDTLVADIREALPGANCGACGYLGCNEYAERLADSSADVPTNLCTPGGSSTVAAVSAILGVDAGEIAIKTAVVHCDGTCGKTSAAVDYAGPPTCEACVTYFGGKGQCSYGCMGFGDCVKVCQYNAIYMDNGVPKVDEELCTGCAMCAKACPHHIISLARAEAEVFVACSSHDKGKFVRDVCSSGCIGCGLCLKKCQYGAIIMDRNLAVIDPDKCTNCGDCAASCPTKVIHTFPFAGAGVS